MSAIEWAAGSVLYAGIMLAVARVTYGRIRPSKVLTCGLAAWEPHMVPTMFGSEARVATKGTDGHFWKCHRRWQAVDCTSESVACSVFPALIWPVFLLCYGVFRLVIMAPAELEEERAYRLWELRKKTDEMERDIRTQEAAQKALEEEL